MANYKYSVENTTKIQREKLKKTALSYSILDAPKPTQGTRDLVDRYVDGDIEISEALALTIEKYRKLGRSRD
ncbi:hypothetical protein [Vagococcus hydrophili]|uniref:Antitoxin VbhA domain-containing protein n=1 Tax=Vagococcus hydrophili TaxID=2714947 RepID=A0A6G8AQZ6_9ENTE|nr:hypothetical protein [Vagococcus hydrophili]QIL47417.1 hypothetical protein G7082_02145 [Vagococcus hydrophili]